MYQTELVNMHLHDHASSLGDKHMQAYFNISPCLAKWRQRFTTRSPKGMNTVDTNASVVCKFYVLSHAHAHAALTWGHVRNKLTKMSARVWKAHI